MAWLISNAEAPVTCRSVCLHGLVCGYRHSAVELCGALSEEVWQKSDPVYSVVTNVCKQLLISRLRHFQGLSVSNRITLATNRVFNAGEGRPF
jgi:hypothetical protein